MKDLLIGTKGRLAFSRMASTVFLQSICSSAIVSPHFKYRFRLATYYRTQGFSKTNKTRLMIRYSGYMYIS